MTHLSSIDIDCTMIDIIKVFYYFLNKNTLEIIIVTQSISTCQPVTCVHRVLDFEEFH